MVTTEEGIVIEVKFVHPINVSRLMVATFDGLSNVT